LFVHLLEFWFCVLPPCWPKSLFLPPPLGYFTVLTKIFFNSPLPCSQVLFLKFCFWPIPASINRYPKKLEHFLDTPCWGRSTTPPPRALFLGGLDVSPSFLFFFSGQSSQSIFQEYFWVFFHSGPFRVRFRDPFRRGFPPPFAPFSLSPFLVLLVFLRWLPSIRSTPSTFGCPLQPLFLFRL